MNTFHVIITVGEHRTVWSCSSRDLALARVTALLTLEPSLDVVEGLSAHTDRTQHTHFELVPGKFGFTALDAMGEMEEVVEKTVVEKTAPDLGPPTAKLGEIIQPHTVTAFAAHTANANIPGFSVKVTPVVHNEAAYSAREMRLMAERDAALTRAENAECDAKQLVDVLADRDHWKRCATVDWAKGPYGNVVDKPVSVIGGPGWCRGVLDCIDVLTAQRANTPHVAAASGMSKAEVGARIGTIDSLITVLERMHDRGKTS